MKFELAAKDVTVLDGKYAQLPFERFAALLDYVEDIEARLLAAEVNLREADRVGHEMEETAVPQNASGSLSMEDDDEQVDRVLQLLESSQLKRAVDEQGVSIRKLAMMTGIPYATLYRYLRRGNSPAAVRILKALREHQRARGTTPKAKGFDENLEILRPASAAMQQNQEIKSR
jgi:DNA-binding NtrC family response regulator